jgi:hypothetical protein
MRTSCREQVKKVHREKMIAIEMPAVVDDVGFS